MIGSRIARELGEIAISLVLLVMLSFVLMRGIPGSPLLSNEIQDSTVTVQLTEELKMNQGLIQQTLSFFNGVLRGDIGHSVVHPEKSIIELVMTAMKASLGLAAVAFLVSIVSSLLMCCALLLFYSQKLFQRLEFLSILMTSIPSLLFAPVLIWFFGFYLNILPVSSLESVLGYILPVVCLSLRPSFLLLRILLTSISEELTAPYIVAARSKGFSFSQVLLRHVFKKTILPFVGGVPSVAIQLFSGSLLVETLFSISGVGFLMVESLSNRDDLVVVCLIFVTGFFSILVSKAADLLIQFLDPRVSLAREN